MFSVSLWRRAAAVLAAVVLPLAWAEPAQAEVSGDATVIRLGYTDDRAPRQAFAWGANPVPVGAWRDAAGRVHVSRVYVTFDLDAYTDSFVRIVILKVKELSGDCGHRDVQIWRTAATSAAPTWATAPRALELVGTLTPADGACPGALGTELQTAFDAAVQRGERAITLELRIAGIKERSVRYGKTLDAAFGVPTVVWHDPRPSIDPATMYNGMKPCATAQPYPYLSHGAELRARGVDADDQWALLRYEFELWPADDPSQVQRGELSPFFQPNLDRDGAVYSWRVRAGDYFTTSAWSPTCSFVADLTGPAAPPTATSPSYDPETTGWVGTTAEFTLGAGGVADVVGYEWTFGEFQGTSCQSDAGGRYTCTPPVDYAAAATPGGSATAQITVPGPGGWQLKVRSVDRAGTWSAPVSFDLWVVLAGPPGVSSDVYTEGSTPSGGVGVAGTFTITAPAGGPEVRSYTWGIGDTWGEAVPGPDGTATVPFTPTAAGPAVLYVHADYGVDAGGEPLYSAPRNYEFTVAG